MSTIHRPAPHGCRFFLVLSVLALTALPVAGAEPVAAHPAPGNPHAPVVSQERQGRLSDVDSKAKFTHFRVGNKNVKSIFAEGTVVWVGTSGGVVRYDTRDDSFKLFDVKDGLLSNGVFWVGKIGGQIAVGTYGGGLSVRNEKTGAWRTYNIPEGLGDAFVYDVVTAKNGDLWIATWSGVNRVRGGALDDRSKWDLFTVENTNGGIPNDWIYGLAEGRNGDIWLATEGGVARYAGGRWENWNHARGLGADFERVKRDIAFKNDPGKQSVHHAQQKEEMGLKDVNVAYNPNYVVSMEVDASGHIWAGTWGGGLSRFDGKRWISYTTAEGLPGNHVFALHRDARGVLWIGTNNGLSRWQNGKFSKSLGAADGLFANNVFSMASSADGALWVGSYGGVSVLRALPR